MWDVAHHTIRLSNMAVGNPISMGIIQWENDPKMEYSPGSRFIARG